VKRCGDLRPDARGFGAGLVRRVADFDATFFAGRVAFAERLALAGRVALAERLALAARLAPAGRLALAGCLALAGRLAAVFAPRARFRPVAVLAMVPSLQALLMAASIGAISRGDQAGREWVWRRRAVLNMEKDREPPRIREKHLVS